VTECEAQQAGYLEGDPDAEAHVRACPTCGQLVAELDVVREVLADPRSWEDAPAGLEDRVVGAVLAAAPAAPVVSLDAARQRRRGLAARVPVWSAAAALVVAVGVTSVIASRQPSARSDANFALAGTDLAAGAHARVALANKPNGVEIRLRITGLPRAPEGSFYEAWVKGDAGLVPIVTFHTGDGEVVLWSGVPVAKYRTITVTLEDEDGNPASSGRRVLVGEIPVAR
jgi:hypothetical protein